MKKLLGSLMLLAFLSTSVVAYAAIPRQEEKKEHKNKGKHEKKEKKEGKEKKKKKEKKD